MWRSIVSLSVVVKLATTDDFVPRNSLSLLFSSPILRKRLDLPEGSRTALAETIKTEWDTYTAEEEDEPANDGFFEYQQDHIGLADQQSSPEGWLMSEAAQELLAGTTEAIEAYLVQLGYPDRFDGDVIPKISADRIHVWASVHSGCSSHTRHVHAHSTASAVYYVSVPSGAGDIEFADPRGAVPPFERTVRVRPEEGELLIFPPWLQVGTTGFTG